jgi:hypothetical protein
LPLEEPNNVMPATDNEVAELELKFRVTIEEFAYLADNEVVAAPWLDEAAE